LGEKSRICPFTEREDQHWIGPTFIQGGLSYDQYAAPARAARKLKK
jgi:hypothetical protein